MNFKRVFLIVIDSVGCGTAPKSALYGDEGANTIGHISEVCGGINLPTMQSLGYGNITPIKGVEENTAPIGSYGKCDELSKGKDTTTGHLEIAGLKTEIPLVTFTDTGFPSDLVAELEARTGHKVIGNKAASGTEILKELGERACDKSRNEMIVYTSSDSVLQICGHEDPEIFGLDELYRCCSIAREICMKKEWRVGRVIARPFVGDNKDNYVRTPNRHDYALDPHGKTDLDILVENNIHTIGVGKIYDIFNGHGINETHKIVSTKDGMEITKNIALDSNFDKGLCFVNLVDFDAKYGHRRDPEGYKNALEEFDGLLNDFMNTVNDDDLVIVTADHGNDPTWHGTDHTREYIPLLVYNKNLKGISLGVRQSFADIGATINDNFKVEQTEIGKSFLSELKRK